MPYTPPAYAALTLAPRLESQRPPLFKHRYLTLTPTPALTLFEAISHISYLISQLCRLSKIQLASARRLASMQAAPKYSLPCTAPCVLFRTCCSLHCVLSMLSHAAYAGGGYRAWTVTCCPCCPMHSAPPQGSSIQWQLIKQPGPRLISPYLPVPYAAGLLP